MAITEEEAELIREDNRAGMTYRDLSKKYKKSFGDIKRALSEEDEGKEDKDKKKPIILPMVTVPKVPASSWNVGVPKSINWVFIGPIHVEVDVINLFNFWRESIDPDTTMDEFISHCVKQYFSVGGITPVILTGVIGGQYGAEIKSRGDRCPDESPRVEATSGPSEQP